ncbi:MAG TPA: transglycosylase domain-containing protein [Mycobacteriales bacterium]|nr:transglycosylase domain-containing protein [Mycobacteriales bacterium]
MRGTLSRIGARLGRPPSRPRSRARRILRIVAWMGVGALVFGLAFLGGLLQAPFPSDATVQESGAVTLLATDGKTKVAEISPAEVRAPLNTLDDVSPFMVDAVVSAEDKNFFSHEGIDPLAVVRAAWDDATGGPKSGASTITEQYVKRVYTGGAHSYLRKIREAALAIRLEQQKPKREILRLYLNTVYFGSGLYGVEAASQGYFGIPAKKLNLAQSALLAGILPAPTTYNPRTKDGYTLAKERQNYVLKRMVADKPSKYTDAQASEAYKADLHIRKANPGTQLDIAPEFTDAVSAELKDKLGDDLFSHGPLVVHTTLDAQLQTALQDSIKTVLDPYGKEAPEAASIAIDPRNGDIRAIATRKDGGYQRGGLDLALDLHRTSGSTIKPFTLAAALDNGYTLYSPYTAVDPATVTAPGCGTVQFHNAADGEENGTYTLAAALSLSINTVYAPLAADIGLPKVRSYGVSAGIPKADYSGKGACPVYPSNALGVETSPADLATAYATLADHGTRHDRHYFTTAVTKAGDTVLDTTKDDPGTKTKITPEVADEVVSAMRSVVKYGTGVGAQGGAPHDLFGKTGTTDNFFDAWFVGCDPTLCLVTWMGYNLPHEMAIGGGVFGGTLPADIYRNTMQEYETNRTAKGLSPLPDGANPSNVPAAPYGGVSAPHSSASPSKGAGKGSGKPGKGNGKPGKGAGNGTGNGGAGSGPGGGGPGGSPPTPPAAPTTEAAPPPTEPPPPVPTP